MANEDRINNRIIEREYKKNFLEGLEAPAIAKEVRFASAEMKRLFGRYFDVTQRNIFMIEEVCRVKLPNEVVVQAEAYLENEMQKSIDEVVRDTIAGEALMKQNGIEELAVYLAKPLDRPVNIISHISTKFMDVFERLDYLLRIVATLRLSRVITTDQQNFRRAQAKRVVRRLASVTRALYVELRKRWGQVPPIVAAASDGGDNLPSAEAAAGSNAESGGELVQPTTKPRKQKQPKQPKPIDGAEITDEPLIAEQ
jgi:hypothetical protein